MQNMPARVRPRAALLLPHRGVGKAWLALTGRTPECWQGQLPCGEQNQAGKTFLRHHNAVAVLGRPQHQVKHVLFHGRDILPLSPEEHLIKCKLNLTQGMNGNINTCPLKTHHIKTRSQEAHPPGENPQKAVLLAEVLSIMCASTHLPPRLGETRANDQTAPPHTRYITTSHQESAGCALKGNN